MRLLVVNAAIPGRISGLESELEILALVRIGEPDGEAEVEVGENATASLRRVTISMVLVV
jgi:hypothetical protein